MFRIHFLNVGQGDCTINREKPVGELSQTKKVNIEIFYLIYRHNELI